MSSSLISITTLTDGVCLSPLFFRTHDTCFSLRYRPPKIKGIRIIENPFDDIVPRITVAEKKAQIQARIEAKKDAEQREKRSRAKKWVVIPYVLCNIYDVAVSEADDLVRNTKLLSFGEAEEVPEEVVKGSKKNMSRQDRESSCVCP